MMKKTNGKQAAWRLAGRLGIALLLMTVIVIAASVACADQGSQFDSFINDSRWANGAEWTSTTTPKLSTLQAWGSKAYCADFTRYCFGVNDPTTGTKFTSASAVKAGDVIVVGSGTSTEHWYVVLDRYTNDTLYVAEGDFQNQAFITKSKYAISNGLINGRSIIGYHCQNTVEKASLDVYFTVNGQVVDTYIEVGSFTISVGGQTHTRVGQYFGTDFVGTAYTISNIAPASGYVYNGNDPMTGIIQRGGTEVRINVESGFIVRYDANGGSGAPAAQVKQRNVDLYLSQTIPVRSGYTFLGWALSRTATSPTYQPGGLYKLNMSVDLYAVWSENKNCTVTFNSEGGSAVATQTVPYGGRATQPKNPTREGYTFDKWVYYPDQEEGYKTFDFSTAITHDYALYAVWKLNAYTVKFNSNGGSEVASQTVYHGGKATAPKNPTREGYTFDKWVYFPYSSTESTSQPFDFNTIITRDYNLYATWILNTCTVRFDSDGGTEVSSQTVAYGKKAVEPKDPTKDGYYFSYWMLNDKPFNFSTAITSNITLKAIWEEEPVDPTPTPAPEWVIVKFDSDGGTEIPDQTLIRGGIAVEPNDPVREGYVFRGWSLNGEFFDFPNTPVNRDITLLANWTAIAPPTVDPDPPTPTPEQPTEKPVDSVVVDGNVYSLNLKKNTATFEGTESASVKKVTIPATIKANQDTVYKVTEIDSYACEGLKNLTSVSIGKNVKTIGKGAFSGCKKLTSVSGGAGVTTIGDGAFKNCAVLTAITLNSNVKSIGKNAFYGCKLLRKIVIKTTKLKTVGDKAFKGIHARAVVTCPKKKLTEYKKLLLKKGMTKTVTFKAQ